MKRIGLIAGSGQFPLIFSKAAKKEGDAVYVAAHLKETDPAIEQEATAIEWVHLVQIKRLIGFFKDYQVTEAVMLGAIKKTRMFKDVRFDIPAIGAKTIETMHQAGASLLVVEAGRTVEQL